MRKIATFVIAGTACSIVSAQNNLDVERAYAAELAADAATRTSYQGSGEGSGFSFTSGDGASTLNINAFMQFRYVADFRDDGAADVGDDDFTHGFEIPRARIDFSGTVAQDNIHYRLSGDFGENREQAEGGGSDQNNFGLTWGYVDYRFESADGVFIRGGQFKAPLLAEELIDPEFQLAGDRSVANETFTQGWSQGLMLGYEAEAFRGYFAVTDGLRSVGTNFNGGREADIGLTARAEVKFAGDWARFTDFTSWRNSDYAGKVGAAVHWDTFGESNPAADGVGGGSVFPLASSGPGVEGDVLVYTADAVVEGNGWNLFGAFLGHHVDADVTGGGGQFDFDDFGLVVQGGVFVTEQIELFGRWDAVFLDDERFAAGTDVDEDMHFLTFGANYFVVPESHAVKASLEILWALSETQALTAGGPAGSVGVLPGTASGAYSPSSFLGQSEDTEIAVRGQISFLF